MDGQYNLKLSHLRLPIEGLPIHTPMYIRISYMQITQFPSYIRSCLVCSTAADDAPERQRHRIPRYDAQQIFRVGDECSPQRLGNQTTAGARLCDVRLGKLIRVTLITGLFGGLFIASARLSLLRSQQMRVPTMYWKLYEIQHVQQVSRMRIWTARDTYRIRS